MNRTNTQSFNITKRMSFYIVSPSLKRNVTSTHPDLLGVDTCDQKRHTRHPVKLNYLSGRCERVQRTDETQVPAFKLAAWRQETMSQKWVTRLTSVVDNAPKTFLCPVTSVVDNALKTKKDTTSSKHCPTRRQKTSSACNESNANSFQGIWMEDSLIQMPCKELALLQLTDATNVQPCTAGTPKKLDPKWVPERAKHSGRKI